MLARHDRISGALAGFAFGVIFTIFMIAVVYLVGRASAGSGGPNQTPRAYPTLTSAPTLTTAPTFTSVPTDTPASTPTPAITPAAAPVIPPTETHPAPTPSPIPTSTFTAVAPSPAPPTAPPAAGSANSAPSASLQAALAVVNDKGYQVIDAAHFDSGGALQVLIGRMVTAAGESAEYAFFFVNGQYLGRDLPQSSASISVAAQTGDTVVIRYALYRPTDPECCPTGGYQDVPYHWDGAHLTPLAAYPTYLADAPLSRR